MHIQVLFNDKQQALVSLAIIYFDEIEATKEESIKIETTKQHNFSIFCIYLCDRLGMLTCQK